jgi:hypothetical protein
MELSLCNYFTFFFGYIRLYLEKKLSFNPANCPT